MIIHAYQFQRLSSLKTLKGPTAYPMKIEDVKNVYATLTQVEETNETYTKPLRRDFKSFGRQVHSTLLTKLQ